ncbi:MAG: S8 family peptidase [Clostridia bacterium]|nr:S8 family peptidase [Clostridia bacterium]
MKKFALFFVLCFCTCFIAGCNFNNEQKETVVTDKIVYQNWGVAVTEENKESVTTEINKDDSTKIAVIELIVEEPNTQFITTVKDKKNIAAIRKELHDYRQGIKKYYTEKNKKLVDQLNIDKIDMEMSISEYTPFIFLREDKISDQAMNSLINISKKDEINRVYILDKYEPQIELSTSINTIMNEYPINSTFNGSGINIGFVESGILDVNDINFVGRSITIRQDPDYPNVIDDHATKVAAIAAGNYGLARGSSIFVAQLEGDLQEEIEWFLDRDVDIINASFGYLTNYGAYDVNSLYVDAIVNNTGILFVGSAGNASDNGLYITTPKTAFNCLTVGSCDLNGNLSDFSSFNETFYISKPNLVAPGENIIVPGFVPTSGTSFSAPLVAGAAAIIMQNDGFLISKPHAVISIISATTDKITSYYTEVSGLSNTVGAGMLNIDRALNYMDTCQSFTVDNTYDDGDIVRVQNVYLNQGECIKICLTFLKNINDSTTSIKLSDFDMYLKFNNEVVDFSACDYNNIEYIEYTAQQSGVYTIQINKYEQTSLSAIDNLSFAYSILEDEE